MKFGKYQNIIKSVNYYIILIFSFVLPLGILPISYAIGLWTLGTILEGNYNFKFRINISNHISKLYFLLFVVLYFFTLLGLLVNKNSSNVIPYLNIRFSLLILPILITLSNDIIKQKTGRILLSYVFGILLATIYCYISAFIHSFYSSGGSLFFNMHPQEAPWENFFLYDRLSAIMHPSYFALYINMAIVILLTSLNNNEFPGLIKQSHKVFIIIYLSITLFLLSSRAGLLTWVLVFSYFFIVIGFQKFRINKNPLVFYPIILITGLFLFIAINGKRYGVIKNEFEEIEKPYEPDHFLGSVSLRLIVWEDALNNIKKHPIFGVGTGNVKGTLYNKLENKKLTQAREKNLNVHNQFLETWLEQGVFALIILLIIMFYPIFSSHFLNKSLLTFLTILIFTNFLFESMLNRLWGVAFFSFFYSFFAFIALPKTLKKTSLGNVN